MKVGWNIIVLYDSLGYWIGRQLNFFGVGGWVNLIIRRKIFILRILINLV